ncbi:hypothetical protein Tco_0459053 [Tanacetum coccineum]
MKAFPLSLADDARRWWIDEGDGKIITWKELVEKFFCKFYPLYRDGEDEMLDEGDNRGVDLLEFISRVNSIFKNHRRVDERTKKALLTSWMNGSWNKEPMDGIPYLDAHEKSGIGKEDERSQKKRLSIRRIQDLAGKKSTKVGEVSINIGILAHKINIGESTKQNIRGVSRSTSFISRF